MIGVFDSGSGGLTVLKAIRERLPSADVVYFGDIGNAPYGEKSREELSRLTVAALKRLQSRGATALISACNSVSASLAISLADVLGLAPASLIEMVGPTVGYFTHFEKPILLAATSATIKSEIYQTAFAMLGKTIDTVAIPELAGAIEFGKPEAELERIIAAAFAPLDVEKYGAVILACTHYPLASGAFRKVLGDVPLFDPAEAVAERVGSQFWPREVGEGRLTFLISAESAPFRARIAESFRGVPYTVEVLE